MLSIQEYIQTHIDKLENYLRQVVDRTALVGEYERKSVLRFLKFKEKYEYREQELRRILKFFSLINIPFKGEIQRMVLADWQVFLIANCYCLYHANTDERVIKEAVISSAGKAGKSTL